ncbi:TonB-dependent receptor [Brevundimonas sp.]|uniref:TonB-dependent receptor n=1 Tax=Brevundimonas sp. TaxID=1871086 RepID=UPI0024876329|nr:TonB-dependent receptor [Brevundimonas sp.]MDI1280499.1 TonB-dependent receptor [Brevundimonas sp.]
MRLTHTSRILLLTASGWAALSGAALAQTTPQTPVPEDTARLEDVIVTGTPFGVTDRASLLAVEVLGAEQLAVAPAATLGDLVNGLPGVRSSSFAPGASRPVIRGLSGPRVQVLTNGLGLIDASSVSPDHQVAVDPAEASRIEIVRGPSTLVFGGSAIGGVVNIIDERVPTTRAENGLDGHVSTQLSSIDNGRGGGASLKTNLGPLVFTIDGYTHQSEDYGISGPAMSQRLADALSVPRPWASTVVNSASAIDQLGAGLSWVGDAGYFGGSVKTTNSTYGTVAEPDVTIQLEQTRYDVRGEHTLGTPWFDKVRLGAAYADYTHTEFEGADTGTVFFSNGYEGRLELIQRPRNGWQGVIGGQLLNRDFDAAGAEAYVPRTTTREHGLYTVQRLDRDAWGIEGGIRFDSHRVDSPLVDLSFDNVSASAGLFVRPSGPLFLGLTIARNARAPSEVELFADGAHVATAAYEHGDPTFDSEVATSIEATMHYASGPLTADLHVYTAHYDGFIDLRPTGVDDVDSGLPIFDYVQTKADFRGFEAEASYDLWVDGDRSLTLSGTADMVRAQTDFGPAARIPPWSAGAQLAWSSRRVDAGVEVRHVGAQDRVTAFELPTDSYTMVNLTGALHPFADHNVTVFGELHNLTNVEAREHASFLKDIAPLPGRNLRVGVTYRF